MTYDKKKVIIFKQFQSSHRDVLEFFWEQKSHAPTVLINSVMHNKSMVQPFKFNIEFS